MVILASCWTLVTSSWSTLLSSWVMLALPPPFSSKFVTLNQDQSCVLKFWNKNMWLYHLRYISTSCQTFSSLTHHKVSRPSKVQTSIKVCYNLKRYVVTDKRNSFRLRSFNGTALLARNHNRCYIWHPLVLKALIYSKNANKDHASQKKSVSLFFHLDLLF